MQLPAGAVHGRAPWAHGAPGGDRWPGSHGVRGWRNTVEIVLFEISNSMKPYPSVFHSYTNNTRPVIGFFEPTKNSMRFPTVSRQPLTAAPSGGERSGLAVKRPARPAWLRRRVFAPETRRSMLRQRPDESHCGPQRADRASQIQTLATRITRSLTTCSVLRHM